MDERIQKYKKSLESAWGYNDYNDWPIKFNMIMHLFLKEFSICYLDGMNEAKKFLSYKEIGDLFYNPARIYRIINPVIYGMRLQRIRLDEQRKIVNEMFDITETMKSGSIFNENGVNLIFSKDKISKLFNSRFHQANKEVAQDLHRFCGVMWAYTEAIFFRAHDVTKEIHGLYDVDDGKLLVREYLNLEARHIWNNISGLGCNTIKIYTIYRKEIEISIDSYNHLFNKKGNINDNLLYYRIEIDGNEVELEQLVELIPSMLNAIHNIQGWVKSANEKDIINRYAEIYWYRIKPLADLQLKNWKPTERVYKNIMEGSIDVRRKNNLSQDSISRLIYTMI